MSLRFEYLPATGVAEQELVLLHGWGCDREVWRPLLALLRPWANITLPEIPGCAAGRALHGYRQMTDVLEAILQCCPPRAVYVGWSLGGQLALELAAREPERASAVVTICSNPRFVASGDWPGMNAEIFSQFRDDVAANAVAALRRFHSLQVTGSERPRDLLRRLPISPGEVLSEPLLAGLDWLETLDQRSVLSMLQQPQLHLLAGRDALVPTEAGPQIAALVEGVATTQVITLPDACHLALLDSAAELERHIRNFLPHNDRLQGRKACAPRLQKREVAASFSRAASLYDSAARLQRDVGERLLTYLDRCSETPDTILDLGCGTGYFHRALMSRYPRAQYLGLDLAAGMVEYARTRCGGAAAWVVADAEALPLASESVDLVFSSLALQWCDRPEHLFAELARILRPGGLCVFTSLGPGTLAELRSAWSAVDAHQHVNTFLAIPELEAAVARIPVLEMRLERSVFRMEYARVRDLLDELKALGAHNMNRHRPAGLTSRKTLQGMLEAYEAFRSNGVLPATYDVVFGLLEKA